MNVFVVGGGEIGSRIAEALYREHNVTIIEADEERATSFDTMDVQFVRGNGTDPDDLRDAGVEHADAFIACTDNDDINVLSCLAAKGLGAKKTLAFVTRQRYIDAFKGRNAVASVATAIDRVLWPQRTLANQIVDIVRVPRAVDSAVFAGGLIKMLEYRMEEGDPFVGQTLNETRMPESVLVVGSIRNEKFIVPSGDTVLCPGDKVVFMGSTESMRRLEAKFARRKRQMFVAIVGGGNVGFMVAQQLQEERAHITVIEQDEARCEKLAYWLPGVTVLKGDGSDLELLEQERVEDADVMVAVTSDDGKNLLVSLLAKQLGIPKVVTRVGRAKNRRLFERVGIDVPLTPRSAAVQEVLNWLHVDDVDHLASIEDRAEVMEVEYPADARSGRLAELGTPKRSLIGALRRDGQVLIPNGNTVIRNGDHLFIVTTPDNVEAVETWIGRKRVPVA
ncbi:MAG TPA: Trk system potassium transporter TrkA [Trueperaceae bacterium]